MKVRIDGKGESIYLEVDKNGEITYVRTYFLDETLDAPTDVDLLLRIEEELDNGMIVIGRKNEMLSNERYLADFKMRIFRKL